MLVVVEKVRGGSWVEETENEGRVVGHCEELDGIGELVDGAARGWTGSSGGDSQL